MHELISSIKDIVKDTIGMVVPLAIADSMKDALALIESRFDRIEAKLNDKESISQAEVKPKPKRTRKSLV